MAKQIDSEKLILWIEKAKENAYESIGFVEGIENPEILACYRNHIFGSQWAYDNIINHIRELQGSDDT